MNIIQRIAKNTGIIILGHIIKGIIMLMITIYLARYLGADGFGIYSFIFAYLMFFEILVDLGMKQILVREISQNKEVADRLLGNAVIMKISLSLISILLASLIISLLNHPFKIKFLTCIASFTLLFSFISIYKVIFEVNLRMEYVVLAEIISEIIRLGIFLFLISLKATLLQFIIGGIIASLPGLAIIISLSNRFIKPTFQLDLKLCKYILKESWPLFLTSVFVIIFMRIDQIMLFYMKGTEAVGYYSAAVRIVETLSIIPLAFMTSVFPLMSEYFKTSKNLWNKTYQLSFKYMVILIIPIAVGTTLLAEPIISFFYKDQFLPSISALQILVWSEVFVFIGVVNNHILIASNKQKIDFIFTSNSAVINVLLNLLLIPKYSFVGAAVATVISYSVGPIMGVFIPATRDYSTAAFKSMIKPFIASIGMGGYICYVSSFNLMFLISTSSIIYFGMLLLIKGLTKEKEEERLFVPTQKHYR